ncbi:MAG: glucosylceramidase [Firmicutes bacterium]|nr:glucosylceramidase [Bacillota bacterium]
MKIRVIRTAKETGELLKELLPLETEKHPIKSEYLVTINPSISFQKHLGFGGAVTEATVFTLAAQINHASRQEVLSAYFSNEGIGYNLVRIHMNSSDFSLENYTYVISGDESLKTFDISREDRYVIPFLKEGLLFQPKLKILISPWSPPAWMKSNNDMNHGGELLPKYYQAWANYYVRFINELKKRGIPTWAMTVQNEPAAVQIWDSCIYSSEQERDFVKSFLGPTLEKNGLSDKKILIWDHNRDIILERALPILNDPIASKYVWGTAFHWYVSEASENLSKLHKLFPDKHLLFTEGCIEGGPKPGVWESGERYARNIINDFNNFSEGFIDWNLVLNEKGGPNHAGNFCDSPILADRSSQSLIYNSSFYFIGQFSKYIRPGAVRIDHKALLPTGVRLVTYRNPDVLLLSLFKMRLIQRNKLVL